LKSSADIEEYGSFTAASLHIDSESCHQAPETEPQEAGYEEAFVSIQIPKPASNQDESSHG
jgi:hypothetical protein